jgi:hypothetical protein
MPRQKSPLKNGTKLRKAPFVFLTLFIILLLIGIAVDEPVRVMEQATRICLSCIGIG